MNQTPKNNLIFFIELHEVTLSFNLIQFHILLLLVALQLDQHFTENTKNLAISFSFKQYFMQLKKKKKESKNDSLGVEINS